MVLSWAISIQKLDVKVAGIMLWNPLQETEETEELEDFLKHSEWKAMAMRVPAGYPIAGWSTMENPK